MGVFHISFPMKIVNMVEKLTNACSSLKTLTLYSCNISSFTVFSDSDGVHHVLSDHESKEGLPTAALWKPSMPLRNFNHCPIPLRSTWNSDTRRRRMPR